MAIKSIAPKENSELLDGGRRVIADDFRVDVQLPHPPRDDLGVLRTEIEDEYLAGHGGGNFFDGINGILGRN